MTRPFPIFSHDKYSQFPQRISTNPMFYIFIILSLYQIRLRNSYYPVELFCLLSLLLSAFCLLPYQDSKNCLTNPDLVLADIPAEASVSSSALAEVDRCYYTSEVDELLYNSKCLRTASQINLFPLAQKTLIRETLQIAVKLSSFKHD